MHKLRKQSIILGALALALVALQSRAAEPQTDLERAVQAAAGAPERQQDESYQRVYESFTRLVQSMSNNSLGNVRRLVSRLNALVGAPAPASAPATTTARPPPPEKEAPRVQRDQTVDERTEQLLDRLDRVNGTTDQHTLRQLNDDVARLVGTLNDSYLRNIRRVIERVNKVVGQPAGAQKAHQSGDRLNDPDQHVPGFPGFDEIIVAMDRMQKSLAHFVRSSTRLITAG